MANLFQNVGFPDGVEVHQFLVDVDFGSIDFKSVYYGEFIQQHSCASAEV